MLPTPAPADAVAGHCHPVTAAILAIVEYKCCKDWGQLLLTFTPRPESGRQCDGYLPVYAKRRVFGSPDAIKPSATDRAISTVNSSIGQSGRMLEFGDGTYQLNLVEDRKFRWRCRFDMRLM